MFHSFCTQILIDHSTKISLLIIHFTISGACYKDGYTKKDFLNELRRAMRNSKNRCHKNNCLARQKLRECNTVVELPLDIVKTEEIYFE